MFHFIPTLWNAEPEQCKSVKAENRDHSRDRCDENEDESKCRLLMQTLNNGVSLAEEISSYSTE